MSSELFLVDCISETPGTIVKCLIIKFLLRRTKIKTKFQLNLRKTKKVVTTVKELTSIKTAVVELFFFVKLLTTYLFTIMGKIEFLKPKLNFL